jgi:hypothetical protein
MIYAGPRSGYRAGGARSRTGPPGRHAAPAARQVPVVLPHLPLRRSSDEFHQCQFRGERGTNENTKSLIREYLQKGTEVPGDIDYLWEVAGSLNGRSRAIPGWACGTSSHQAAFPNLLWIGIGCRLLGLYDGEDLKDAEPGTLRPGCGPCDLERSPPRRGRSWCCPEHIGQHCRPLGIRGPGKATENGHDTISNKRRPRLESSRPSGGRDLAKRGRTFRCIPRMRIPGGSVYRQKCQWCYPEISPERDRYSR